MKLKAPTARLMALSLVAAFSLMVAERDCAAQKNGRTVVQVPQKQPVDDEKRASQEVTVVSLGLYDGRNPGYVETVRVPETRVRSVNYTVQVPDGRGGTELQTRTAQEEYVVEVPVSEMKLLPAGKFNLRTLGGKRIERREFISRLKTNQPAILLKSGAKMDPFYASMFHDEVIVIELD